MAGKKKTENLPLFLTPEQASKVSGIGVNRVRQLSVNLMMVCQSSRLISCRFTSCPFIL